MTNLSNHRLPRFAILEAWDLNLSMISSFKAAPECNPRAVLLGFCTDRRGNQQLPNSILVMLYRVWFFHSSKSRFLRIPEYWAVAEGLTINSTYHSTAFTTLLEQCLSLGQGLENLTVICMKVIHPDHSLGLSMPRETLLSSELRQPTNPPLYSFIALFAIDTEWGNAS